ncbi:MAG: O-antigen ligase family protein [Chlorobium sp.]|nr:O-antigen ligase family protein [Chlorobium sp.]
MMRLVDIMAKKDTKPLPLVFILLFYSGTVVGLQNVFPVMRFIYPQTIFAGTAILLAVVSFFNGNSALKFDGVQKYFAAYCIFATLGLYRSTEVGCLTQGIESVSILWKHLIFLVIIIAFTRTLSVLIFVQKWILITVALFVLHSTKAIFAGYTGVAGRFDNYIGLISNSDYIGIFTAIFVIVFLHCALHAQKIISRLFWAVLGVFSLFIMVKTQTRAAVVVLGVLVPCWLLITSSSKNEIFRKGVVLLLSVGAVFVIGGLSGSRYGSYFDRISTITRYDTDEADFNTKSRFFMWKQGLAIGIANPLLGVGSGATAPHLELNFEGVELKNKASNVEGFSIHNTFIQIFAERGIAGLVPFCLMWLYAYNNFNAVARYARGQPEKRQLVILADVGRLYLVGYVVGAMFASIDYDWTLFAFVALAVSSRQYIQENNVKKTVVANPVREICI